MGHFMSSVTKSRLATIITEQQSNAAKLLRCLEQGGERLNDEAVGLRKTYTNKPL